MVYGLEIGRLRSLPSWHVIHHCGGLCGPPPSERGMTRAIDLNSDLGEGYGAWKMGDDAAMLGIVVPPTSRRISRGRSAGHPCHPARGGGASSPSARMFHIPTAWALAAGPWIGLGRADGRWIYQIGALQGLCAAAGTRVTYVKPHGALTTPSPAMPGRRRRSSRGSRIDPTLILMGLAGAPILRRRARPG